MVSEAGFPFTTAIAPSKTQTWIVVKETSFKLSSCSHFSVYPFPLSRGSVSTREKWVENLPESNSVHSGRGLKVEGIPCR